MTKPNRQQLPEPISMYERDCAFDDLVAALFWGSITESDFMRRATHQFDLDYHEAVAIVVEARERESGNG